MIVGATDWQVTPEAELLPPDFVLNKPNSLNAGDFMYKCCNQYKKNIVNDELLISGLVQLSVISMSR